MLIVYDDFECIFKFFCVGVVFYLLKCSDLYMIKDVLEIVFRGGVYMFLFIVRKVVDYFVFK